MQEFRTITYVGSRKSRRIQGNFVHRIIRTYRSVGPEPFIWLFALVYLMLIYPSSGSDFSFCPLHILGLTWCPGCGLGRSISFLLHGQLQASFKAHLLGIPATIILIHRVLSLLLSGWKRRITPRTIHIKE